MKRNWIIILIIWVIITQLILSGEFKARNVFGARVASFRACDNPAKTIQQHAYCPAAMPIRRFKIFNFVILNFRRDWIDEKFKSEFRIKRSRFFTKKLNNWSLKSATWIGWAGTETYLLRDRWAVFFTSVIFYDRGFIFLIFSKIILYGFDWLGCCYALNIWVVIFKLFTLIK